MDVTLPGGHASISSREDISERTFRVVDRARTKTVNLSARLIAAGYEPDVDKLPEAEREAASLSNVELVTGLCDADQDTMNDYQTKLILALTTSWSFDAQITEDSVLDLPRATFEALAKACQDELEGTSLDTDPDPNP